MSKRVGVDLDSGIYNELQKRANKELLSLKELIEDILRRSVVQSKARKRGSSYQGPKVERFVEYFSRYRPYAKRRVKKKIKRRR